MSQRWSEIEGFFHQAVALPPEQRPGFLDNACADDAMRREINGLLDADDSGESLPPPFLSSTRELAPGSQLSHYEILGLIGQGGMGTVYRARDTVNSGTVSSGIVAIKVFPPFSSADHRRRCLQEARALSALHHPSVVGVHEIFNTGSFDCLVMEYVEGQTLDRLIPSGGLPVPIALRYARMVLDGMRAAHEAGVIHRDLKPANLILSDSGQIKILDFGLAKLTPSGADQSLKTISGQILGTAAYLSPEQAEGKPVDARSDIFSFGAVLYEMLTGKRPFERDSLASTLAAILRDTPEPLARFCPQAPRELRRIVDLCLAKKREERYASADEVLTDISACEVRYAALPGRFRQLTKRKTILIPGLVCLLLVVMGLSFWSIRQARIWQARRTIVPQIARLVQQHRYSAADQLVEQIETFLPREQQVIEFQRDYRMRASIATTPAGAEIAIQDYNTPGAPWRVLGKAPLENRFFPINYLRWRVTAPGFRTGEFAETVVLQPTLAFALSPLNGSPADMVRIPRGNTFSSVRVPVPAFWLDRFEVTNASYQKFVDAGGYRRAEYWREPFRKDGRTLPWEDAIRLFRDQTGMPGPATWQLGSFPEGQGDLPVTGVSWYEAAAYARFAGKNLPTYYHWNRAARTEWIYADTVLASNFSRKGLLPVGAAHAVDRFGTYDLTGNCKEWVANEWNGDNRMALGGAWNEAYYASVILDAAPPLARRADIGFRCAKFDAEPPPNLTAPFVDRVVRDYAIEKPVDDATFLQIRRTFDYPAKPLHERVEATDESSPYWRKLKISFDAPYEGPRITAFLFLPRRSKPPYQVVVYSPSGIAYTEKSSERLEMWYLDPLIRAGRAVLYPVLWGMYERRGPPPGPGIDRDRVRAIRKVQDIRRSVDYLETRPDIARGKVAYFGFSSGATEGPLALANDSRFEAAILAVAGLDQKKLPVDIDPFQFAPRIRTPVLMINGRYDVASPLETSLRPLFNSLGPPAADKKLVLLETGHAMVGYVETTRESLAWLDRYLGEAAP